ncbi:hypothetical protein [Sphingopyxis macrogoltabida]|uniref:Uncharacterized protein n=1 Tax=Sphingopyxis macrogoltabida TaxID=33050 RepID=A0A0N9V0Y0_SPHMC|nr:hypothetical protein [Sphingopyxis macrogoltabida]ALH82932.1 hypothetical protein AN936_22015 [Sphingopyxis macrogoltabida]
MTGPSVFEGFAPARLRTSAACLADAEAALEAEWRREQNAEQDPLGERPLDLKLLVGMEVAAVEPHRDGWRMRFGCGTVIHFNRGATFDVAGHSVIEP